MCAICHACGSELTAVANGGESQGSQNCLNVDDGGPMQCKFCDEKKEQYSTRKDVLSPCTTPEISPTTSLSSSSSDSSVSSYSKCSWIFLFTEVFTYCNYVSTRSFGR